MVQPIFTDKTFPKPAVLELVPSLSPDALSDQTEPVSSFLGRLERQRRYYQITHSGNRYNGTDSFRLYESEANQFPLLTAEESQYLTRIIEADRLDQGIRSSARDLSWHTQQSPDAKKASQFLYEANLRLVIGLAKHYTRTGVDPMDLIGDSLQVLRILVNNCPSHIMFPAYAYPRLKKYTERKAPQYKSCVHLGRNTHEKINRASHKRFKQDQEAVPADAATAELYYLANLISLDAPLESDNGTSLGELVIDESIEVEALTIFGLHDRERLQAAVDLLTEPNRFIVGSYYGFPGFEPLTQAQIGERLGMSQRGVGKRLESIHRFLGKQLTPPTLDNRGKM